MTEVKRYRTKEETIEYFRWLAVGFERAMSGADTEEEKQFYRGKAEAYEIAAFELERNMK